MLSIGRLARHSSVQFTVALIAAASWLSGCGDDEEGDGGGNGKGGSGPTGGSAGSPTGGRAGSSTTGGSAGSPTGGSAGGPMGGSAGGPTGGSAGTTGGSAGSAGAGMGGEGMGGEGMGGEGMGGEGMGGEGGSTDAMCTRANLSVELVSSSTMQAHDHEPTGASLTTLFNMINTGMPLVFTLPEDGSNPHQHTLTFTAPQLTTLRNGGTIAMITSSTNGPMGNMHTHTYSIECAP